MINSITTFIHRRRLRKLAMRRADKRAGNNPAATIREYRSVHETLARGRRKNMLTYPFEE